MDRYLDVCVAKHAEVVNYLGSSVAAAVVALGHNKPLRVEAWDLNPLCTMQLAVALSGFDKHEVQVSTGPATPSALSGRPDLLFIDPPDREGWEKKLVGFCQHQNAPRSVLEWLPVSGARINATTGRPQGLTGTWHCTTVIWPNPGGVAQRTIGCELIYTLPGTAVTALQKAVNEVVALMGGSWTVQHRVL